MEAYTAFLLVKGRPRDSRAARSRRRILRTLGGQTKIVPGSLRPLARDVSALGVRMAALGQSWAALPTPARADRTRQAVPPAWRPALELARASAIPRRPVSHQALGAAQQWS